MTDAEAKQLLLNILTNAEEGKSIEFHFITSWAEFRHCSRLIKSTKLIVKTLTASANRLFKEYCKDVIAGISDVNKLLAYSQLQEVINFYEWDIATLQYMLDEYDEYLGKGHFWYSFLGGEREI